MINLQQMIMAYLPFFNVVASESAINPMALLLLSHDITQGNIKLLKANNFFAIKYKTAKDFHKYPTIFDGINAGIDKLKSHPDFVKNKIGTLKANQNLQYQKLKSLIKL
jgi:hypothetical protein